MPAAYSARARFAATIKAIAGKSLRLAGGACPAAFLRISALQGAVLALLAGNAREVKEALECLDRKPVADLFSIATDVLGSGCSDLTSFVEAADVAEKGLLGHSGSHTGFSQELGK